MIVRCNRYRSRVAGAGKCVSARLPEVRRRNQLERSRRQAVKIR